MRKKPGKAKGKSRGKRVAVKDLAAKKGGAKGGGIGLLLPAVQKVREAAGHSGGVQVALGDGSVRFLNESISQQ